MFFYFLVILEKALVLDAYIVRELDKSGAKMTPTFPTTR